MKVFGCEMSLPKCVKNHPKRTLAGGLMTTVVLALLGLTFGGKIPIGHLFCKKATWITAGSLGGGTAVGVLIQKTLSKGNNEAWKETPINECKDGWETSLQRLSSEKPFRGKYFLRGGEYSFERKEGANMIETWKDGKKQSEISKLHFPGSVKELSSKTGFFIALMPEIEGRG